MLSFGNAFNKDDVDLLHGTAFLNLILPYPLQQNLRLMVFRRGSMPMGANPGRNAGDGQEGEDILPNILTTRS